MAMFLFSVGLGAVLYVLFGYPLLLAFLARRASKPVHPADELRSVTILLPVYNGEAYLHQKLESLAALNYPKNLVDIIVISDGSTDRTAEIARGFAGCKIRVIDLTRSGKAAALNRGIQEAQGQVLLFTDVRQRLEPDSLHRLVVCLADPSVGVVSGELIIQDGDTHEEASVGLYWEYEKWIRHKLSSIDSILGATGCLYAIRRELAAPMPANVLLDDVYQPLQAFFKGYRSVVEERARAIDFPTSLRTEFWRKIRTQSGLYQILWTHPGLLTSANRMRFHFVSHKLGRLLLPFALLCMLVSSLWLPGGWRSAALVSQALFYLLALLDFAVPERWRVKPATSVVRTFVTLSAAAFCAPFTFLLRTRTFWNPTKASMKHVS